MIVFRNNIVSLLQQIKQKRNTMKKLILKLIFGEPKKGEKVDLIFTINPKVVERERQNNLTDFNKWIYNIHTHNNKFQNSIR